MLDRLTAAGIKYVFVSNSDNLGATLDVDLLVYFAETDKSFVMEASICSLSRLLWKMVFALSTCHWPEVFGLVPAVWLHANLVTILLPLMYPCGQCHLLRETC